MFNHKTRTYSVATALSAVHLCSAAVLAGFVGESEPNNSIATAQNIDAAFTQDFIGIIQDGMGNNTSTLIPHASVIGINNFSATPDYYSFTVNGPGLSGVFDIDATPFSDTSLYLFDSAGNLLAQSTGQTSVDPGSFTLNDPFLEYTFSSAGLYVIGVGGALSSAGPGGIVGPGPSFFDSYLLNASVAVPEPVSTVLFCTGIAGLNFCRRRKKRRAEETPGEVASYGDASA